MEYFIENPDLFLVSENESGINGFCMEYLINGTDFPKRFLRHNFTKVILRFSWLLLSGKRLAWEKILRVSRNIDDVKFVDQSYKNIDSDRKVDLLSICVVPELRGSGIASELIESFHKVGKEKGREYCVLSVKQNNERGINFYRKHGYKISKETKEKIFLIKDI